MIRTDSACRRIGARLALVAVATAVLPLVGPPAAAEAQPAPTTAPSSVDPGPSGTTAVTTRPITTVTRTTTTTIGHCCISAEFSPTSGLTDGSVVHVTLRASGNASFNDPTPIQLCKSETGWCPVAEPPSPAADTLIDVRPPSGQGTFTVPFRIGTGPFRTTTSPGNPYTFFCGPDEPCFLRVSFGSQFGTVPITRSTRLTYARAPATTTTATTRPAHPLCVHRSRIPAWLWAVLVALFGISC